MATFHYTALDKTDAFVRGKIVANTIKRATSDLEREGFLIVNIKRERRAGFEKINHILSRITRLDKIFFTRHLYTLLESGISLDKAIHITAEQTENYKFKEILFAIYKNTQAGQSLHSSLAQYPKCFSNFFVSLVKVGEQSGKLDEVLLHILEQQEKDQELITKVRGALIYPAIIVTAAIIIVCFMMIFVVPRITEILSEYNVKLPFLTRVLIAVSNFFVHSGIVALPLGIIAIIVFWRMWVKSKKGKVQWDALKLKIPVLKQIVIEFNLARISRAMCALLKSGVAMDNAMELAASVSSNAHYVKSYTDSIKFIQKGVSLTDILIAYPKLYPPITLRMVEVGERSGKLDHMFDRLAHFYEKSVANTLGNLSTIIEPLLMLIIGCIIGLLGVAILTPIWKFSETV